MVFRDGEAPLHLFLFGVGLQVNVKLDRLFWVVGAILQGSSGEVFGWSCILADGFRASGRIDVYGGWMG